MKIEMKSQEAQTAVPFAAMVTGRCYYECRSDGSKNGKLVIRTDENTAVHLDTGTEIHERHASSCRYMEANARVVVED